MMMTIPNREIVRPRLTRQRLCLNDSSNDDDGPLRTMWQVSDVHLSTRPPLYPPPVHYRLVRASPSTVAARIDAFLRGVAVCHHDETCLTAYYASGESLHVYLFKHSAHVTMVECLGRASSQHAISLLQASQGLSSAEPPVRPITHDDNNKVAMYDDARRVCDWLRKDRLDVQTLGLQLLFFLLKEYKYHALLLGTCPHLPLESQYIHKFCRNHVLTNSMHTCLVLQCFSQVRVEDDSILVQALWKHLEGCARPPGQPGNMSCAHEAYYACICLFSMAQHKRKKMEIQHSLLDKARHCHSYKPLQQQAERFYELTHKQQQQA